MSLTDIQFQKSEWRKKSWSIPDLSGGKQEYFSLVKQLVELISSQSCKAYLHQNYGVIMHLF